MAQSWGCVGVTVWADVVTCMVWFKIGLKYWLCQYKKHEIYIANQEIDYGWVHFWRRSSKL